MKKGAYIIIQTDDNDVSDVVDCADTLKEAKAKAKDLAGQASLRDDELDNIFTVAKILAEFEVPNPYTESDEAKKMGKKSVEP